MNRQDLIELFNKLEKSDNTTAFDNMCNELYKHDKICVFGMGNFGMRILPQINERLGNRIICVSDNDPVKQGKLFFGLRCISSEELLAYKDNIHIFVSIHCANDVIEDLTQKGFNVINKSLKFEAFSAFINKQSVELYKKNREKIYRAFSLLTDESSKKTFISRLRYNLFPEDFAAYQEPLHEVYTADQYFPKDIIRLTEDEVFVDCGGYDGDTIREFLSRSNNNFRHIYSFEIDGDNFLKIDNFVKILSDNISNKITLYKCGVWNCKESLYLSGNASVTQVCKEKLFSKDNVELETLDNVLYHQIQERVTFIKMDVEGSELNAIMGAEKTIKANRPKLAICVYHKPEDMYEIPLIIHEFLPEYRIYFRHHGHDWYSTVETVCYAI